MFWFWYIFNLSFIVFIDVHVIFTLTLTILFFISFFEELFESLTTFVRLKPFFYSIHTDSVILEELSSVFISSLIDQSLIFQHVIIDIYFFLTALNLLIERFLLVFFFKNLIQFIVKGLVDTFWVDFSSVEEFSIYMFLFFVQFLWFKLKPLTIISLKLRPFLFANFRNYQIIIKLFFSSKWSCIELVKYLFF